MATGIIINPDKLKEAREARAYNITQLAELVGVTRQAMSKYEKGNSNISIGILTKISDVLDFPRSFFLKPTEDIPSDGTVFYRSMKSSEANVRNMIHIKCRWAYHFYNYLENIITMPEVNLPNFDNILNNHGDLTYEKINEVANYLRGYWQLGKRPIGNLIQLLEQNGFIVSGGKINADKTDACSEMIGNKPVIFYDKTLKSACRIRFSLAHELGHMILHSYITKEDLEDKDTLKRIEKEANTFASCFLLPENFMLDVYSTSLESFLYLKEKWKVSIGAMIYRCKDLKIIGDSQYLSLRKKISYKHWVKVEPLDDIIPYEKTSLFKQAINFIIDNLSITKYDIVNHFSLNKKDLSDIVGVPTQFWEDDSFTPKFQIIK